MCIKQRFGLNRNAVFSQLFIALQFFHSFHDPVRQELLEGRQRIRGRRRAVRKELHGAGCLPAPGFPAGQGHPTEILAVRITGFDKVAEVVAHLPGQVIMPAGERSPALCQGFKPEPQVGGMERAGIVPSGHIRIKQVAVALPAGLRDFRQNPLHRALDTADRRIALA